MKVFLAWSGDASQRIASILRDWFPTVLPYVQPFLSTEDIRKGQRWIPEIARELHETSFGILCVVPDNVASAWLNFEAGAISASMERARVAPFLFEVDPKEVPETISQFQCTRYDKDDLHRLSESINSVADKRLLESAFERNFRVAWPGLHERLEPLVKEFANPRPRARVAIDETELDGEQLRILETLSNIGDEAVDAGVLARQLGMRQQRVEFHVRVLEERDLILRHLYMGRPSKYELSQEGRKLLIQKGLL